MLVFFCINILASKLFDNCIDIEKVMQGICYAIHPWKLLYRNVERQKILSRICIIKKKFTHPTLYFKTQSTSLKQDSLLRNQIKIFILERNNK